MIPILAIVVDIPAIKGNAPQIPQPVKPKRKSLKDSDFNFFFLCTISLKKNGIKMINTVNHLQNAKEIGGTYSTPPLATIIFDAIKIGWTNKSNKG